MRGVDKTSPAHAARGTRTWPRARDRSVASLFPAWAALAIAGRLGHHAFLICKAIEAEGELVFAKVSEMGLEGIVSKRAGSVYKSGRCLAEDAESGVRPLSARRGDRKDSATLASW